VALVRFAFICDHCSDRGREYESYPHCIKCNDDVCSHCYVTGSYDEETMTAICKQCASEPVGKGISSSKGMGK
jgi:hypothetical protein